MIPDGPRTSMTSPDSADRSHLAVREALAALSRGDDAGASMIARAHAAYAQGRPSRRVVLLMPFWRIQGSDVDPGQACGGEAEESA